MPQETKSPFAQNLKALRLAAKLTQAEAATNADVRRESWGSYEEDRCEPCYEVLLKITRSLGVPDEDLSAVITDPRYHLGRKVPAKGRSEVLLQYYKLKPRQKLAVDILLGLIEENQFTKQKQNK